MVSLSLIDSVCHDDIAWSTFLLTCVFFAVLFNVMFCYDYDNLPVQGQHENELQLLLKTFDPAG